LVTLLAIMKCVSRPKSTAVKDIDVYIADTLCQKYGYQIDIGKGDISMVLYISYTAVLAM